MRGVSDIGSGARIVVAKALAVGPGEFLEPGTDVTEQAKDWPTLSTHLKRGYLVVVAGFAGPDVASPPASGLAALRELNATASKDTLRSALALAGIEVPDGASRHQMLKIRSDALKVA